MNHLLQENQQSNTLLNSHDETSLLEFDFSLCHGYHGYYE